MVSLLTDTSNLGWDSSMELEMDILQEEGLSLIKQFDGEFQKVMNFSTFL